ncbi:hypothetical protein F2Q70_00010212 [Brassica cretica]|uniref:Uncharacterized protein n=3 Tax=Brassica cretica TaxID=69181 RepID=A0A8S9MB92_BRACR|nr:hypothetical protein F2Q70_00010212 [Brassica cretica]
MMAAPRRGSDEGSQSASSQANETDSAIDDEGRALQFQTMWSIKKHDLVMKERLSKMKLLDSLIAKQDPLPDYEEALKKKLINKLMSD